MGEHYGEVGCCRPISCLLLLLMLGGLCGGQFMVDPITRPCNDMVSTWGHVRVTIRNGGNEGKTDEAEVTARASKNTYVAGGVMAALVSMPADLSGFFEFYLCPEEGNTAQEECLFRLPLQLADGSGIRYHLADVPDKKLHEVLLILPDEVTCDTCTLQLRVVMKKCTGGGRQLDNGLDFNEMSEMEEEKEGEKEDQEPDDDEEEREEEKEADEDGEKETKEEICKAISQLFCSDISIRQVK
ncbi:hypothetical protein Pmani_030624 [Petrolisthes manimaculis]|uniref:Uncharacterized protein n=1 Tax=Petrolisthes manimaculis TaxID=1843537 RepID=A0AAE1TSQ1_9EUCA|nr:hypothetical protein Pmani_030624 [Petrolisthes manimaculis]